MFCSCFILFLVSCLVIYEVWSLARAKEIKRQLTMTILSALAIISRWRRRRCLTFVTLQQMSVTRMKSHETEEKFCQICHPRESWERIVLWRHHLVRVLAHLGIRVAQSGTTWWVDGGNAVGALKHLETSRIWSCELSDFQWFWHDRSEMFQINMISSDCCCISVGIYPCQELQKWNYKHISWKCEVEEILACTALARRRGDFQVMVFIPWIKQKASSKVSYVSWTNILVSCVLGQGRMLSAKPRSQFAVLLLAPLSDRCVWFSIFLQLRGWNCRDQKCKRGSYSHSLFGGSCWNFLRSWHHSVIEYMILSFYLSLYSYVLGLHVSECLCSLLSMVEIEASAGLQHLLENNVQKVQERYLRQNL